MIYTKTKKELIKLKRMLEMSNFGGGKWHIGERIKIIPHDCEQWKPGKYKYSDINIFAAWINDNGKTYILYEPKETGEIEYIDKNKITKRRYISNSQDLAEEIRKDTLEILEKEITNNRS
jgi:hypothetical protein